MLAVSTMLSPTLLVSPLRTTGAPLLRTSAPVRVPSLRMDGKGSWVNGKWIAKGDAAYWMSPSLTGAAATSAASVLDTTPKFEEIATAAATQGSAAAAEGFEPGTCDPYDPKSAEFCSPAAEEDAPFLSKRTLKLGVLFFLWYALNTAYNIGNKLVLTALPIPWTSATIELFFGLPYVGMLWLTGLRKKPKLSLDNIKTLAPSAFFLSATHVGGVISFGAGAISFTHVLKATEPVWTVLLSAVFFREFLPWQIYASLIPIVGGVGLASLKEVSFSWLSFIAGTGSAVTSASKAILSKKVLDGKPLGENLTPANMFAVLTILGCFMLLPFSLAIEGPKTVQTAWVAARAAGYTASRLWTLLGVSGFLYYIYNEVAFLALSEVAPVTHAVTNTVKRVVIILASILVFRTPITLLGSIGSGLAILGALLYSLAKGKYK
jgi:solute carrier family 35 protein E1